MTDIYKVAIQAILKACQDGKPQHELVLHVCDTPQCLIDCGFDPLPIVITGRVVDKAHFDHGITKGMLERLPQLLAAPKAIFSSASHADSAVVLTFELKGANHIIVPVHRDKQIGRDKTIYNVVASVYDKRAENEAQWRREGLLLWEPVPAPVTPVTAAAVPEVEQAKK